MQVPSRSEIFREYMKRMNRFEKEKKDLRESNIKRLNYLNQIPRCKNNGREPGE